MSSNTVVFFPSFSKEELTPLDIAALERAAWQLEAMNALLAESSLPLVKNGKVVTARDCVHPRSDPPNVVADEGVKRASKASPSDSPDMTLNDIVPSLFLGAEKSDYGHGRVESMGLAYTSYMSDDYILEPSLSATSDSSSELSCFEEVYQAFLAPIRTPLAPKHTNAPSSKPAKSASCVSKAGGHSVNQKENQTQPRKLFRRKAVCYPLGVRPTKAIPIKNVTAFRPRPCISQAPPLKVSAMLPSFTDKVNYQDFAFRHLLGSGSQGRVYLAKYHRDTRSPLLAVKVLKKSTERDTECVMQEHKVLKRLRGSPFILNLQAAFNDSLNWYLITDYHCGGDLQTALFRRGRFDEDTTRFYAAEIILALNFLHEGGIIHRDMKLSNVLLRKDGHISIADFGLVYTFDDGKSYKTGPDGNMLATGCCGTRTHMAPEILADKSYTCSADWWSFGVCLYAMLQGELPWSPDKIGWSGTGPTFHPLTFNPDITMSTQALSLMHGLLQKLPQFRMAVSDLQAHSFFTGVDWGNAGKMGLHPPFLPRDDGDILVDQPLPRYLDFLRGATEPVIPDRFPEFYFLSPALGGEDSVPISSSTDQNNISLHGTHFPPSPPQAPEAKPESSIHLLPIPLVETRPSLWPTSEDDPTILAALQSVCLLSTSVSNPASLDYNTSIIPNNIINLPQNAKEVENNISSKKNNLPDMMDWIVSIGRKILRSFKRCCKIMAAT